MNISSPLRNENILLRGSTLKIAPVVYGNLITQKISARKFINLKLLIGCAIYTGKDTKLMLNSKFKANKLSCIERLY